MDFSMKLNDNKAGLAGLDKDRINAIIKEASKDSLFTKHQEKRAKRIEERIRQQQETIAKLTTEQIRISELEMDKLGKQMEESRDLSRTVVHIDMDAFYAAVEMRDDPRLRDKPMAVGGMSMLSTSNYLARRFGVRAAMAGYIGKKLCPQLIIVPCNFKKYTAVGEQVRAIMAEYDPNFVAIGLDEATLDITDYLTERKATAGDHEEENHRKGRIHRRRRYAGDCICKLPRCNDGELKEEMDRSTEICEKCGKERVIVEDEINFGDTLEEVTNELRFRIEQETGLTASAGISVNRMLAKVCSDINKPNGQYYLPPDYESIMEFVRKLPIRKVSGIGGVTESMLKSIGIETCKELFEKRGLLALIYLPSSYRFFLRVALGLGSAMFDSSTDDDSGRKSIGVERTFLETSDPDQLTEICKKLCQKAVDHMKSENLKAKTITLKLKTVEFDVKTRATTLDNFVCDFESVFNTANNALSAEIAASAPKKLRLRLMGVRLSSFQHETEAIRSKQLPDITRYLRRRPARPDGDSSLAASSASPTKSLILKIDENSVDSTSSVGNAASTDEEEEEGEDELIVLSDEEDLNDNHEEEEASSTSSSSAVAETSTNATASRNDVKHHERTKQADDGAVATSSSSFRFCSPIVCPVCNCKFTGFTSDSFNLHLDQCLNRKTISTLVKEQDRELESSSTISKSPVVEKGKKATSGKRKSLSPSKSQAQKRFSNESVQTMKKIDEYFKPKAPM